MSDELSPEPDDTDDDETANLIEILTELGAAADKVAEVARTLREQMDAAKQAAYNEEAKRTIDIYNAIARSATAVKDAESALEARRKKPDGADASKESDADTSITKPGEAKPKRDRAPDNALKRTQAAMNQRRKLREQDTAHLKQQLEQRAADFTRYVAIVTQQKQLLQGGKKRPKGGHAVGQPAVNIGSTNVGIVSPQIPVTNYATGEPDYDEDSQPNEGFLRRNRDRLRRNRALRAVDAKLPPGAPSIDPFVTGKIKNRVAYIQGKTNRRRLYRESKKTPEQKVIEDLQKQAGTNGAQPAPVAGGQKEQAASSAADSNVGSKLNVAPGFPLSSPQATDQPKYHLQAQGLRMKSNSNTGAKESNEVSRAGREEIESGANIDSAVSLEVPRRRAAVGPGRLTASVEPATEVADLSDVTQQVSDAIAQAGGAQGRRDEAILTSLQTVLQWLGQVKDQASNTAQIADTMSANARARAQA